AVTTSAGNPEGTSVASEGCDAIEVSFSEGAAGSEMAGAGAAAISTTDCAIAAVVCGVMTESRMCCQVSQAAAASDATGVSSGQVEAGAPDAEVPAAAAAANADPAASGEACSSGSKVGASIDDGSTTPSGEVVATAWAVCISRSSSSEASSAESAT